MITCDDHKITHALFSPGSAPKLQAHRNWIPNPWLSSEPFNLRKIQSSQDFTEFIYTKICMGLFEENNTTRAVFARLRQFEVTVLEQVFIGALLGDHLVILNMQPMTSKWKNGDMLRQTDPENPRN